jgi:hypothetical protein
MIVILANIYFGINQKEFFYLNVALLGGVLEFFIRKK